MAGNSKSIDQQIAELEAKKARLMDKKRKEDAGQKIILGGLLLAEARTTPKIRSWLLKMAAEKVTREADKERLAPLLEELKAMPVTEEKEPEPASTTSSTGGQSTYSANYSRSDG